MKIVRSGIKNDLIHVRKTVTFTGATGLGEAGTVVPVFTTTGRVGVERLTAFCTETLVSTSNLGTISLGVPTTDDAFAEAFTVAAGAAATNEWWDALITDFVAGSATDMMEGISRTGVSLSENIIINPLTQDITDGTLVIDCWYLPITDNGALAAA